MEFIALFVGEENSIRLDTVETHGREKKRLPSFIEFRLVHSIYSYHLAGDEIIPGLLY